MKSHRLSMARRPSPLSAATSFRSIPVIEEEHLRESFDFLRCSNLFIPNINVVLIPKIPHADDLEQELIWGKPDLPLLENLLEGVLYV
ncbi:hypothetical protein LIER_17253 [Lithospermum erythrorhizon]|uniref:Uncharacterized protein n=1 Tax=Lithospermum erythrorhizon TaxID=34254 RepID=A0AAV3QDR0_LITER